VNAAMKNALKVDLHLHTAEDPEDLISHDAQTLVDRAHDYGFGAIAITLHDRQFSDSRLADYAEDLGLTLIRGIERTIEGRHILLLNFPSAVERVQSFADIAALKTRSNGIVIAPHPFFPHRTCLGAQMDAHADLFDALEWSYFWTKGANFNKRAMRWAQEHGKPLVGNSDLHDIRQLGRTYSLVDAERSADAVCDAIRAGRTSLRTAPVPKAELASVLTGMFRRGRRTTVPARALATT
jgi:predicted metal-dependent phosphoesterase TrpH